jgi:hypothetical protein
MTRIRIFPEKQSTLRIQAQIIPLAQQVPHLKKYLWVPSSPSNTTIQAVDQLRTFTQRMRSGSPVRKMLDLTGMVCAMRPMSSSIGFDKFFFIEQPFCWTKHSESKMVGSFSKLRSLLSSSQMQNARLIAYLS